VKRPRAADTACRLRPVQTGKFIVLEGPDGSGKSTQATLLFGRLREAGHPVTHHRDPGTTDMGESIRRILLDPAVGALDSRTELLLFLAARAQMVAERIQPELAEGRIVLCERFLLSTVVYQGHALGVAPPEVIWTLGRFSTGGLEPDLTVILDVDPAEGFARKIPLLVETAATLDRIESRDHDFHARVRNGYIAEAAKDPTHMVILGSRPIAEMHSAILEQVNRVLARR